MAKNKKIVYFMLNSADSLDDAIKSLEEDKSIEILKSLKNNHVILLVELNENLDENYEIIFKIQEKIENLFPPDVPYSLDYHFFNELKINREANKDQETYSLFGHSDHKKINNYKLTQYYKIKDYKWIGFATNPKDKNLKKLDRRYMALIWNLPFLKADEGNYLNRGMYVRFRMRFGISNSISQEDFENIFNIIKNLKHTHYIEKIHSGFGIIEYVENPYYDHILNKEFVEKYYNYNDIIRPQILEFGHDLIEGIKNKINCDYELTFATTNPGYFDTLVGGKIIVKQDSDRPFIDICSCPKKNLKIDETVIDYDTSKFEEYHRKVLSW